MNLVNMYELVMTLLAAAAPAAPAAEGKAVPQLPPQNDGYADPNTTFFPLASLQTSCPEGVNPASKEVRSICLNEYVSPPTTLL